MNAFSSSLPLTKNAQKPPHNWIVSIDGQHSKVRQKPKAMRYAFLQKHIGRNEHLRELFHPRHEIAESRLQLPLHNVPIAVNVNSPNRPTCCTQDHEKAASRTAKKANAQGG